MYQGPASALRNLDQICHNLGGHHKGYEAAGWEQHPAKIYRIHGWDRGGLALLDFEER
jgi:hypothetical protein